MGETFVPGFRAAAFGISTASQTLVFSVVGAVINILFITAMCSIFSDWTGRIAGCLVYYGALLLFVWARLLAVKSYHDTGDLCMGLFMLLLSTVLWIVRYRRKERQ